MGHWRNLGPVSRLPVKPLGHRIRFFVVLKSVPSRFQNFQVSLKVVRSLSLYAHCFALGDLHPKFREDLHGNLILQVEDVFKASVVAL